MRLHLNDPYLSKPSVIHRTPAVVKLSVTLSIVITTVILPRSMWTGYIAIAATLVLAFAVARLPVIPILKRLALVEPFVLMVALLSLFQHNGAFIFALLLTRGTISVFAMILLVSTTRFSDLLHVLWRLHIPSILVTTLSLMYRYLFLIVDEMNRLTRARASRTFVKGRWQMWNLHGGIIGHMFVRTSVRAERIFAAMCARGWKT